MYLLESFQRLKASRNKEYTSGSKGKLTSKKMIFGITRKKEKGEEDDKLQCKAQT